MERFFVFLVFWVFYFFKQSWEGALLDRFFWWYRKRVRRALLLNGAIRTRKLRLLAELTLSLSPGLTRKRAFLHNTGNPMTLSVMQLESWKRKLQPPAEEFWWGKVNLTFPTIIPSKQGAGKKYTTLEDRGGFFKVQSSDPSLNTWLRSLSPWAYASHFAETADFALLGHF